MLSARFSRQDAQIRGVVDPRSGREIPLNDAVSHGIVDFVSGMYVNIVTGERVPLDRAVRDGLVRKEGSPLRDLPTPTPGSAPASATQTMQSQVSMAQSTGPRMPGPPQQQQQQQGGFTEYHHFESSRMSTHQVSRVPASPQQQVSRVRASTTVSETPSSASAVQSAVIPRSAPQQQQQQPIRGPAVSAETPYRTQHSVQQSFLGVGPPSTDPGGGGVPGPGPPAPGGPAPAPPVVGITYTEALQRGLIDTTHAEFRDPRTGDRMPVELARRKGLLVRGGPGDDGPEESLPDDSLDDSSDMLGGDRGTISADDEGDSLYSRDSTLLEDTTR